MKNTARSGLLTICFCLGLSACHSESESTQTSTPAHTQAQTQNTEFAAVSIMTLNAQNLFDNVDDPGKDDKAYLPIEAKQNAEHQAECEQIKNKHWRRECSDQDWSDAAVDQKLSVIAEVIRQVGDGRGADIIAFQEVENERILERLRLDHLADLGYGPSILVEGTDRRGIDVAFLSKLPVEGTPILHPLNLGDHIEGAGDTRGILEARFLLPDGSALTGYAVHFPAPFHPTVMRVAAYEHLRSLRQSRPDDELAFAAGDFNTTSTEDEREELLAQWVRPEWQVAHDFCEDCPGTYYYAPDDNWSFLDMIIVSHASEDTAWNIRDDSVRIANALPAQNKANGTPARYNAESGEGASDHWPLVLTLEAVHRPSP